MMDIVTLSKAKKYTDNSIAGIDGSLAGKNCKVQSVEDITGGHRITLSWNDDGDVARTYSFDVMDGRSIEDVEIKYASSQSGTTPPSGSGDWSTAVPSVPDGHYLWTKNTLTFSDGNTEIEYLVGKQGFSPTVAVTDISGGHKVRIADEGGNHDFNVMDGLAIDFIDVEYAESASGTTAPSVGWQSNPPEVAAGNYLWTRNTTHLKDNTTSVAYMVALQGAAGISPTVDTTPVSGGNRITITDKDGPHQFTIYDGVDGTDGRDGSDGQDGFSPIVTTSKAGKTTTVTIVDAAGTKYATVLDGVDGRTIASITINSSNHVVVTYSDGTTSDAGELVVQSAVMSVNGRTGSVVLGAEDVGALPDDTPLFSGDYGDLTNKPNIPAMQLQSDWNQTDTASKDYIKNKPTLGTAAAKNAPSSGNAGASQVVMGSDTRLTDARTPTAHTHTKSEITDFPTLGTASGKDYTTNVSEGVTDLPTGGAVKAAIDSAISRVYKPAGNKTMAELTSALLAKANLGNVYNMTTSGTTTSDFVEGAGKAIDAGANVAVVDVGTSSASSYKFDLLSGMVDMSNFVQKSNTSGLLKNDGSVDTTAYAKQSEMSVTDGTGTNADKVTIQLKSGASATVLKSHQDISGKVDKVTGKGLSTNDYTAAEKNKLAGIAAGAEVNVQSDWTQTDTSKDDYIKNKPALAAVATSGSYNDLSNKPTVTRGTKTFTGTEIANILPEATAYTITTASTGVTSNTMAVIVGDEYINELTMDVWKCTTAGTVQSSSAARWTYEGRRKTDKDDSNTFRFFCDGKKADYNNNSQSASLIQEEVEGENPFGTTSKLLKVTRLAGVAAAAFTRVVPFSKNVKIDSSCTYRYACYVKKTNDKMVDYFGLRGSERVSSTVYNSAVCNLNGTEVASSYHTSTANFGTLNRWYLVVGYVTGKDMSTAPDGSGVYDMVTKKKVRDCTNYRFKDITSAYHTGTLIEYTGTDQTPAEDDTTYIYDIRFDKMDGNEPSLDELLGLDTTPKSKGEWTADTDYFIGDIVSYSGSSYICRANHNSGSTFSASNWNKVADKGQPGANAVTYEIECPSTYKKGDAVTFNFYKWESGTRTAASVYYKCEDTSDGTNWTAFSSGTGTGTGWIPTVRDTSTKVRCTIYTQQNGTVLDWKHSIRVDDIDSFTGTLPVANGGTGQTSAVDIVNEVIQAGIAPKTDAPSDVGDDTEFVTTHKDGYSSTNKGLYRRTANKLWNYIKSKIENDGDIIPSFYMDMTGSGGTVVGTIKFLVNDRVVSTANLAVPVFGWSDAEGLVPIGNTFPTNDKDDYYLTAEGKWRAVCEAAAGVTDDLYGNLSIGYVLDDLIDRIRRLESDVQSLESDVLDILRLEIV